MADPLIASESPTSANYLLTANMMTLKNRMLVNANNIANSQTSGFSMDIPVESGIPTYVGVDNSMTFAMDVGSYRDTTPGTPRLTDNPLDVALARPGYFYVQGGRYTRAGQFAINSENNTLLTLQGDTILDEGGGEIFVEGEVLPTGLQAGMGARVTATSRIMTDGIPQQTDGTYDIAIMGSGYFQVATTDGIAYTRDSHFSLDANSQIVDLQGRVLQPGLTIPANANNVTISPAGVVKTTIAATVT